MSSQTGIFVVRAVLGFCFLMHGLQNVLPYKWLGGMTHRAFSAFLRRGGVPWHDLAAYVVPWAEVVAGVALLVGFAHKCHKIHNKCSDFILFMYPAEVIFP